MENEPDEGESRTTIWQELDKWAESLHPWERFVLATAVRERRLSVSCAKDPTVVIHRRFISKGKI